MKPEFHYGGQALIEGVMMRGQRHVAVAVRRPDGNIAVTTQPLSRLYTGPWRERPLARGIIVLAEMLTIGLRALMYSAKAAMGEEEAMPRGAVGGAVVAAVLFAVGLFFALPYLLARLLGLQAGGNFTAHLAEGGLRLAVFIGYLLLVGRWSEVARVFAYHGAEHKVVNAYEGGVALEVEAVRGFSTAHKRCGTSFVLLVLLIAIPVFALMGKPPLWAALPLRLALVPVIAAASYEIIRLGGSHPHHPLVRTVLAPGMVIQAMTTRHPDDSQLEVALAAMKGVLVAEGVLPSPPLLARKGAEDESGGTPLRLSALRTSDSDPSDLSRLWWERGEKGELGGVPPSPPAPMNRGHPCGFRPPVLPHNILPISL